MKMKPWQIITAGWLLAPLPPILLIWHTSAAWIISPYALCVMFVRQAQHAPDSLGAAGIPDLLVAFLQFPMIGRLLAKSLQESSIKQMWTRIIVCHLAVIGSAVLLAKFRNHVWNN
ncbi:MAG: hypothetical protein ABI042_10870 [Verrucomicrobiota bacterium]